MKKWICILIISCFLFPGPSADQYQYNIDAAVPLSRSKAVLWNGAEYIKFDITFQEAASGYPKITKTILDNFPFESIDAVAELTPGKACFFNGDEFFNYDLSLNKPIHKTPYKIDEETWPGITFRKIDAAFRLKKTIYLFSGSQFEAFDLEALQALPGYPQAISGKTWPGLSFSRIDAAFNYQDKNVFFFSGEEYVNFDLKDYKVKAGYPKKIQDKWKGVRFKTGTGGEEKEEKPVSAEKGLRFFKGTWDEALELAQAEKKAIMVVAYTDWSEPSRWMEKNILADEKTAEFYTENFINLKLNMEKGAGITFAWDHDVTAYPTVLYFDSPGNPVHRFTGKKSTRAFIDEGRKVLLKIASGTDISPPENTDQADLEDWIKGKPDGTEIITPLSSQFEKRVLQLVNSERSKKGLSPLSWRDDLGNSARYHAADMGIEDYFDHNSHDRTAAGGLKYVCDTWERIKPFASSPGAENIAAGQAAPEAVMDSWMNSPGHRANILNGDLKYLGVGYYYYPDSTYGHYWVQNFGY